MQTAENQQGLHKILDLTRMLSIAILLIHFYFYCYGGFREMGWTSGFVDQVFMGISRTGLLSGMNTSKAIALAVLGVSLIGARGRKEEKLKKKTVLIYLLTGLGLYFLSSLFFHTGLRPTTLTFTYITFTTLGFILFMTGGTLASRILKGNINEDIFNEKNQSFPQEERLLENEYSINLPTKYNLQGKKREGWINIINPFRGNLVVGTPGAGKSYFVIRHIITQHIKKGFSMFVYDFKFDDLSRIAYNALLKYHKNYKVVPNFYVINFDDLSRTHRCNPLMPETMNDITDATESARTMLLGLNREWIKKQGDFFVESPINFVTAVIWFLKKYEGGRYCTLPHVIELMQADYNLLFPVLGTEKEIEVFINPFLNAYLNGAAEQLEGQIASAKIGMAPLSSPQLYYVLSGNDFTLDINNPKDPKIVCMGNNPQKRQVYGAVLSLYISRMIRLVNQKGGIKSSLIFDEFPTIYFNDIDSFIATARSNKAATTLAVQDQSQMKKDYGRELAEVIMNIVGNVISGQAAGETAKQISERIGKINQQKQSITINSNDTSISRSTQLDYAVPQSTISTLSSGEFVGIIADDPTQKIQHKAFHAEIQNDHEAIRKEEENYVVIPKIRDISTDSIQENYLQIKRDVQTIIHTVIEHIRNTPELHHLLIIKENELEPEQS